MSITEQMALSLIDSQPLSAQTAATTLSVEGVYREHFAAVWRLLRRLGVAEAQLDDAAQDVFLVVHRRLADFDAQVPARQWIFAIAVRIASEYRRRASRRQLDPLPEAIVDTSPGPAERTELNESVQLLHELLSELETKKRTVFVLAELEQLSAPEIAEVLGVNLNTVYSRLRAARNRFEASLERRRARSRKGRTS